MSVLVACLVLATVAAGRALGRRRRAALVLRRFPARAAGASVLPLPPAPTWFAGALAAADVRGSPSSLFAGVLGAAVAAGAAGAFAGGAALAAVGSGAVAAGAALALRLLGDRGDRRYEAALPLGLELVARSLRSGASLLHALDEAPGTDPVGADLRAIAADVRRGRPLADALAAWPVRRPLPGVRLASAALVLGVETGGAQARAVDGVASTLRERTAVAAEVRALASQARYSALVIALAPLLFCAVTAATDARSAEFLLRTPAGVAVLAAGLALDGAAAAWMARLTRTVTP